MGGVDPSSVLRGQVNISIKLTPDNSGVIPSNQLLLIAILQVR